MSNSIKTVFLFFCMTAVFIFVGNFFAGSYGIFFAIVFALITNFFSYWFSDKIVLKMYNARPIDVEKYKHIYEILERLSLNANIKKPNLYIIDEESPNAFATGRNQNTAVIAITDGLLKIANDSELEGVLAHEVAHIKNRDILLGSIVATFAAAIMGMLFILRWSVIFGGSDGGGDQDNEGLGIFGVFFVTIFATIAATLIQLAISRNREYLADKTGVLISGNPFGLVNALKKISSFHGNFISVRNSSTSHMFIFTPSTNGKMKNLFLTHPPLEDRIARILSYSKK